MFYRLLVPRYSEPQGDKTNCITIGEYMLKEAKPIMKSKDSTNMIIPLYHKIHIQLYRDIAAGVYKVGDAIPTEISLMERFNASRTTVRKALSKLVGEGIVTREV